MVDIPRFTPQTTSTNLSSIRGITTAAEQASANLFKDLASVSSRQLEIINAREDERVAAESKVKGIEAGAQDDFDPNGIPKENTIAAKAFKAGAFQTYTITQQTQLDNGLAEIEAKNLGNPQGYIQAAEGFIKATTEAMPTEIGVNMQLLATRKANASFIRIKKQALAKQEAFARKSLSDELRSLSDIIPDYNPQSEAEMQELEGLKARFITLQQSGISTGTLTPGEAVMQNKKLTDQMNLNVITRGVVQSEDPVAALNSVLHDDSIPIDIKSAVTSRAMQLQAGFDRADRELEEQEEIRRNQRNLDLLKTLELEPESEDIESFIADMKSDARDHVEWYAVEAFEEKVDNIRAGKFVESSSAEFEGEINVRALNNEITDQEIQELTASNGPNSLSVAAANKAKNLLNLNRQSLLSGPTMQVIKSNADALFPVTKVTPFEAMTNPKLKAEADRNLENIKLKQAILTDMQQKILDGEITSESQQLAIWKELKAVALQDENQNRTFNTDIKKQIDDGNRSRKITRIKNDPRTSTNSPVVRSRLESTMALNPKLTRPAALGSVLKDAVSKGEITNQHADDLMFMMMSEENND